MSYPMAQSAAWRSLSGAAVKVWVELRTRFYGGNNGKLYLSLDEAARLLGIGKATVQRAFKELETKGFIVKTRHGRWYGRMATQWRTTDKGADGDMPTYDWKRWVPDRPTRTKKQSLGSKADRIGTLTGPGENRDLGLWLCAEPVTSTSRPSIGSEMDRSYNHAPVQTSRRAEPLGERSATASGGTTNGLVPISTVLPGSLAATGEGNRKRGAQ